MDFVSISVVMPTDESGGGLLHYLVTTEQCGTYSTDKQHLIVVVVLGNTRSQVDLLNTIT